jgi:3',5'-cyclic AMP phosphodiesterase CpdA
MGTTRREFLVRSLAGGASLTFRPPARLAAGLEPLRFGMCADVHKDVMHDADERLATYLKAMAAREADFVVQMGDFCQPIEANDGFMKVWRGSPLPTYDVIGNHDMDGATREQTLAYMDRDPGYYTFVKGGYRFIVLDGNDRHEGAPSGYPRHVGPEQRAWLTEQLAETEEPVIILSHQSLENGNGLDNGPEMRAILEAANERAGWQRILACFSGHHHLDALVEVNRIPYVQVNSMSYYWVGGSHRHKSYPDEVHTAHPWIEYTSPYRDALYACVTIDPKGELRIEGVQSEWVGPSPQALGRELGPNRQGVRPQVEQRASDTGR